MTPGLDPAHVAWCRRLWANLRDGGEWAIPRSGIIFRKDVSRNALVLVARMPWTEEMAAAAREGKNVPPNAAELRAHQDDELEQNRLHFAEFGVDVFEEIDPRIEAIMGPR